MYKNNGFTLIELMIVVVIIGILAAIAYPSYQEQVRQTRRANAQADLMELASYMGRFYTENFTYVGTKNALPFAQSPKTGTAYYTIAVDPTPTATSYRLVATAQGSQADDTNCTSMTITQTGATTPAGCW
ncbi:type IV pilin protein [Methylophaga sulfidovorans]|uniref:Type IV pilus assembly protein PilE n=1 Tax=Methylophaga sulfidovorans TaxID=45496 RepID=A0A1I3WW03_9GAMM|nr:type IV pilin protein [Methylophaga sulfidovorans]SFK11483.1 type IV pilus assembly protein PilE [Methylophaga sulfidovorans]